MKKTKLIGIICLAVVIGLAMAACDDGSNGGGDDPIGPSGAVVGIVVSRFPTLMVYGFDEEFEPDGMVVSAVYENGYRSPITGYEVTGLPGTVARATTLTITYGDFMTTLTVTVINKSKVRAANPIVTHSDLGLLTPGQTYSVSRNSSISATSPTPGMECWAQAGTLTPSKDSDRAYRCDNTPFSLNPSNANRIVASNGVMTVKVACSDGNNTFYDSEVMFFYFTFSD